jgi:DMSO/TMAO reductase YedYZ molybdopterin-dependent catalytic subunit
VSDERDVQEELKRLSRRGFLTMAAAAGAGYAGWKWLDTRPREEGLAWPLRRALHANESLARTYFSEARLSPQFAAKDITRARINGGLGLKSELDVDAWRLHIEGLGAPVSLSLHELQSLPKRTMITELRCIEGWSTIVQWGGVRLSDVVARIAPPRLTRFVSMETPDRAYYIGLDIESALHPQTLLAFEMNGASLPALHGAPLRLAIPVKYGIKNIKRIGTIRFTDVRPADFWGERGYDWYAGH